MDQEAHTNKDTLKVCSLLEQVFSAKSYLLSGSQFMTPHVAARGQAGNSPVQSVWSKTTPCGAW